MISKEALHALRERFLRGTRVELVKMDDPQAPPIGTKGTVLSVVYGEDFCRVISNEPEQKRSEPCEQ